MSIGAGREIARGVRRRSTGRPAGPSLKPRGRCLDFSLTVAHNHRSLCGHSPPRVDKGGKEVLITDAEHLKDVLARTSGTYIVAEGKEG